MIYIEHTVPSTFLRVGCRNLLKKDAFENLVKELQLDELIVALIQSDPKSDPFAVVLEDNDHFNNLTASHNKIIFFAVTKDQLHELNNSNTLEHDIRQLNREGKLNYIKR